MLLCLFLSGVEKVGGETGEMDIAEGLGWLDTRGPEGLSDHLRLKFLFSFIECFEFSFELGEEHAVSFIGFGNLPDSSGSLIGVLVVGFAFAEEVVFVRGLVVSGDVFVTFALVLTEIKALFVGASGDKVFLVAHGNGGRPLG